MFALFHIKLVANIHSRVHIALFKTQGGGGGYVHLKHNNLTALGILTLIHVDITKYPFSPFLKLFGVTSAFPE